MQNSKTTASPHRRILLRVMAWVPVAPRRANRANIWTATLICAVIPLLCGYAAALTTSHALPASILLYGLDCLITRVRLRLDAYFRQAPSYACRALVLQLDYWVTTSLYRLAYLAFLLPRSIPPLTHRQYLRLGPLTFSILCVTTGYGYGLRQRCLVDLL